MKEPGFRIYLLMGVLFLVFHTYCVFRNGESSRVPLHDDLEVLPSITVLKNENAFFAPSDKLVESFLGGQPRACFPPERVIGVLLYNYFPPFYCLVINSFFQKLFAFVGMFLLARSFLSKESPSIISWGAGISYSLIPFMHWNFLSVAGMPLLFHAFFRILDGDRRWFWFLCLFIFPFYSRVPFGFSAYLGLFGILLWDLTSKKRFNLYGWICILIIICAIFFAESRLVGGIILNPSFQSNRQVKQIESDNKMLSERLFEVLLLGLYEARGFQKYFIWLAIIIALSMATSKHSSQDEEKNSTKLTLLILPSIWLVFLVVFFQSDHWSKLAQSFGLPFLMRFNFSRIGYLVPVLFNLLFALSLEFIFQVSRKGKLIVLSLLTCHFVFLLSMASIDRNLTSFKGFFSTDLFEEIKAFIGRPTKDYRVGSLFIHPNIAIYNGFYTLDGYANIFSLEYKLKFRAIIKDELKNYGGKMEKIFDEMGNRCYLSFFDVFSTKESLYKLMLNNRDAHLPLNIPSEVLAALKCAPNNIFIDVKAFKDLGGEYLFSAFQITNATQKGIRYLKTFERSDSPWIVHLYQVGTQTPQLLATNTVEMNLASETEKIEDPNSIKKQTYQKIEKSE